MTWSARVSPSRSVRSPTAATAWAGSRTGGSCSCATALPGELVTVEITEERNGYLRADAVEILRSSPDRVTPPCPYAGPDRCGGCDFQHVEPAAQRALKTAVVREQLIRIGRLTEDEVDALGLTVEPLPGGGAGGALGWRTRLRYTVDADDRAGLLKHRSHEVVAVERAGSRRPRCRRPGRPTGAGRAMTRSRWSRRAPATCR